MNKKKQILIYESSSVLYEDVKDQLRIKIKLK